jgi:hypothetical protein
VSTHFRSKKSEVEKVAMGWDPCKSNDRSNGCIRISVETSLGKPSIVKLNYVVRKSVVGL